MRFNRNGTVEFRSGSEENPESVKLGDLKCSCHSLKWQLCKLFCRLHGYDDLWKYCLSRTSYSWLSTKVSFKFILQLVRDLTNYNRQIITHHIIVSEAALLKLSNIRGIRAEAVQRPAGRGSEENSKQRLMMGAESVTHGDRLLILILCRPIKYKTDRMSSFYIQTGRQFRSLRQLRRDKPNGGRGPFSLLSSRLGRGGFGAGAGPVGSSWCC